MSEHDVRRSSSVSSTGGWRSSWLPITLALVLGVTACGGGSDVGDGAAGDDGQPTPINVAAAVVDSHGPDQGFAAVVYALDAGYTTDQLADAALGVGIEPDGTIAGVDPRDAEHDLIAPPAAGLLQRSAETTQHTPAQVQAAMGSQLPTIASYVVLGAALGIMPMDLIDDSDRPSPAAAARAKEMIGVLITLMDVGYSFDQALTGWLFGETQLAVGIDKSGETDAGQTFGGYPVAPCLALRDSNGQVVAPAGSGPNALFTSATCARALSAGTVTFDDVNSLLRSEPTSEATTDPADPAEEADQTTPGDVRSFSGTVDLAEFGGDAGMHANSGRLDAGSDLTGTIEFYGESQPFGGESDTWICSGIRIVMPPGAVVATDETSYAGTADYFLAFQSGQCAGSPAFEGPGPATIVASINGATLTASITVIDVEAGDETTFELVADEVSA